MSGGVKNGRWRVEDRGFSTPCWIWLGNIDGRGYGQTKDRKEMAHRAVYQEHVGPIPSGLELDHLCNVRACVNPFGHLEPVTHAENCRRARASHCPNGHPRTPDNTYIDKGGGFHCRTCRNAKQRRRRERLGRAA